MGDKWRITARVRLNGKIRQLQETITCNKEEAKLRHEQLKADLRNPARQSCSLTNTTEIILRTFGDTIDFYVQRKGSGGMAAIFGVLKRELGPVPLSDIGSKFDAFLEWLKATNATNTGRKRMPSTINRYIACAKIVFGFALKMRKVTGIKENPLSGFQTEPEEGRDRIWNGDEREAMFKIMQENKRLAHLYWAVYFCEHNPIRRGDLFRLTRDNLDMFKPWVHFYPSKTRKRKPRETCLPFLDEALLAYFKELPADCPYLFPRIYRNRAGAIVRWKPMGDIRSAWEAICLKAKAADFHFHDLKHCAITWMLDSGFSELDLRNLGIQYDGKMIARYYHRDASKVADKWKAMQCESIVKSQRVENG